MAIKSKQVLTAALIIAATGFIFETNAQTRRRGKPRRTTVYRPQPPPVQTLEPAVISRAEDEFNDQTTTANPDATNADVNVERPVRPRNRTNGKTEIADKDEGSLRDLERLTLAEERAGALRRQLEEIIDRESVLRSKIEQLDYQGRPEIIEREVAVIGSLRPEVERDNRRKIVENEKKRTNDQLTQVTANRTRLEGAVANADLLVDKLRARVETGVEKDKTGRGDVSSTDSSPPVEDNQEENPNL